MLSYSFTVPELPEVETIKNDLQKTLTGEKILGLWWDSTKQLKPSPSSVEKNIVGMTIEKIARRAKLIQFYLSNKKILVAHLKLTGRLLIRKSQDEKDRWSHIILKLSDGRELRFCDMRKFGYMRLIESEEELNEILKEFGPEPLTPEFTQEKFQEILSRFKGPIKLLLMDQTKVAGVGNIYANDALFLAGIHPQAKANKLLSDQAIKLYQSLLKVLEEGIKYRGASDQSYLDAFGKEGQYQRHFRVYSRDGEDCLNHCGSKIKRIVVGGRGTFFCPKCQTMSCNV